MKSGKSLYERGLFLVTLLSALCLGTGMVVGGQARAAPPNIILTEGAVAVSSGSATYVPGPPAPVSFSSSGACPRWSGTINDTNLATTPINSNISASDLDAGDLVTFAVTLQNTSDTAAYDVILKGSVLPAGFELPGTGAQGANLCVTDGAGTALPFTAGGTGFFGTTANDNIQLTDGASGAVTAASPTSGQNIVVVTFDLRVTANANPASSKSVESELINYASSEGGAPLGSDNDTASVVMGDLLLSKTLQATSQTFTTGNDGVVGEEMTYSLTITVPEGDMSNVRLVDTMAPGLAFVSCESITNNNPGVVSTNLAGGLSSACNDPSNPVVSSNAEDITFTLGDLVNADRNEAANETITLVYKAVVNNVPAATNAASLSNSAVVRWDTGHSASASAPVIVREATLQTTFQAAPASAKPGDIVHFTATLSHAAGSLVAAQDVLAASQLPNGLTLVPGSLDCAAGTATLATCDFVNDTLLNATLASLPVNGTIIISFDAIINAGVTTTLNAGVTTGWSSLPGDVTAPQSDYATTTTERTGDSSDPGGAANNYVSLAQAAVAMQPDGDTGTGGSDDDSDNEAIPDSSEGDNLANTGDELWVSLAVGGVLITLAIVLLTTRNQVKAPRRLIE